MKLIVLLNVVTVTFAFLFQCPLEDLPQGSYSRSLPDASLMLQLQNLFPESARPDHTVTLNEQVLYTVILPAKLEVSFLHDGGVFPSTFGYYIYNSATNRAEQQTILFPDVNCARIGDTINIGNFSVGTRIGFFLIAPQNSTSYKFWSFEAENSTNPDNITHVSRTYINQEFIIGFEDIYEGGDEDYNDVLLMVRPAEVPTTCCCEKDIPPGSLECYEAANLVVIVSTLFLGFAAAAIQDLIRRRNKPNKGRGKNGRTVVQPPADSDTPSSSSRHGTQKNLCIMAAVLFLIAIGLSFAYRIHAASDASKFNNLCPLAILAGSLTGLGALLVFIAALLSCNNKPTHENSNHATDSNIPMKVSEGATNQTRGNTSEEESTPSSSSGQVAEVESRHVPERGNALEGKRTSTSS